MPITRGFTSVLVASICAIALAASSASAATVANTNDAGPGSLRQAVIDAVPGETITVPAGTYTLTSGPMLIEKNLTIAGAGAGSTVIRGGANRVFVFVGVANATVSGITFRDTAVTTEAIQGGILYSVESNLSVSGVVFTANSFNATQPAGGGGAIQGGLLLSIDGSLSVSDSQLVNNSFDANAAPGQKGGSIQGAAIIYIGENTGTLAIAGTSISNNVFDVRGGQGPSSALQQGGSIQGGALLAIGATTSPITVRNSSITGNSMLAGGGPGGKGGNVQGGALLVTGANFNMTADTVAANVAQTGGGNVQGAGILISTSAPFKTNFVSSTIVGNAGDGAGMASLGGNLYMTEGVSFANTVVAGGVGPAGSENCFFEPGEAPTSLGFNLDSLKQCGFTAPSDRVNTDPQLGPLQNNGGPTATMLPAATSPLVDQGAAFGLTADQRGVQRPIEFPSIPNAAGGDGSDIGAVELQPVSEFGWGKLQKNKKKGTAVLTVSLPTPNVGVVTLSGKGLKPRSKAVTGTASKITLVVATKGKVKKALRKKGKRKVAIKVTYTPTANAAVTKVRKVKLVRKQQPKRSKQR